MTAPLVSVCVPNLNMRPYLPERIETVFSQSYTNWELIISDNYSDDGSWEYFQEVAERDQRVSISQAPKEGMYANWNRCISKAGGEYVYIATSDDTMAPDCLEKMVMALEKHHDCDIAHCVGNTIDGNGRQVADPSWPDATVFALGAPEYVHKRHIRRAPYDGLLHLTGRAVYLSITQLLIRRSLFDRIGLFIPRWGSIGDLNWNMKAGLISNTIHVPETWATYRVHASQATAAVPYFATKYALQVEELIEDAISTCEPFLKPEIRRGLDSKWLKLSKEMRLYYAELRIRREPKARRLFQTRSAISGPSSVRHELLRRIFFRSKWPDCAPTEIRTWLDNLYGISVLSPVS